MNDESGYDGDDKIDPGSKNLLSKEVRDELKTWFAKNAPTLLSAYEASLHLLSTPNFPGRLNLLGHAIRDLIGNLSYALDGAIESQKHAGEGYPARIDQIDSVWPRSTSQIVGDDVLVPSVAARCVDELLDFRRTITKQKTSDEKLAAALVNWNKVPGSVKTNRLVSIFKEQRKWFVAFAHFSANRVPQVDETELHNRVNEVYRAIHAIIGSFFVGTAEIDAIISKKSFDDPSKLSALLASAQHARYFFEQINSPDWIPILEDLKVFEDIPSIETVDEHLVHNPCYALAYLARVADQAPERSIRIAKTIRSDNLQAIQAVIAIANAVSTTYKLELLNHLIAIACDPGLGSFAIDVTNIVVALCDAGKAKQALKLARVLLDVGQTANSKKYSNKRVYFNVFNKIWKPLAEVLPNDFLRCMIQQVFAANEAKVEKDWEPDFDGSFIWRPAIEEHPENNDSVFESELISSVRVLLEFAVEKSLITCSDLIAMLRKKSCRVLFKRFELHFLARYGDLVPEMAVAEILNEKVFDDYRLMHEYAQLCLRQFPLLKEKERDWFAWLESGPSLDEFESRFNENVGRSPTDQDRKERIDSWQLSKLHLVRDHLSGHWKEVYADLCRQYGEPEMADFNIRIRSYWGGESPIVKEELMKMDFSKALDWVCSWKPGNQIEPSMTGLRLVFKEYLESLGNTLFSHADELAGKPINVLNIFLEALSKMSPDCVDISNALRLCDSVIENATKKEEQKVIFVPTESTDLVASVIRSICLADVGTNYRDAIWGIVEKLIFFHGPSAILGRGWRDPRAFDFRLHARNSPSGSAMHTVFEYSKWVIRNHHKGDMPAEGFGALSEVQSLLEACLSANDPGEFYLRSVIGENVSFLRTLDRDWFVQNSNKIFDFSASEQDSTNCLGWAAWNSFLYSTYPTYDCFVDLRQQFNCLAEIVASFRKEDLSEDDPVSRAGQYLAILFIRGSINFETENAILTRFLKNADPIIRIRVLLRAGYSLLNQREELSTDIRLRYEQIWDWYWDQHGKKDLELIPKTDVFTSWFTSRRLSSAWNLNRFAEYLLVVLEPEDEMEVFETLAETMDADYVRTSDILLSLVTNYRENWKLYSSLSTIRTILENLQKKPSTKSRSFEIINALGRRGFHEFGTLLA